MTPEPASARGTLSREKVVRTAVEMADASGGKIPSTRKLAEQLGVQAMALYHHFHNKDALLDAMVDSVFAEIDLPTEGEDWKPEMRRRAASMREALIRHPWAIALMDSRANAGLATLRHHNAVIGCLRAQGFTVAGAAHAFSLLDAYIYGFVFQELALPFESPGDLEEIAAPILEQAALEGFPHLAELAIEHALKPGYNYADEFWIGLDLILNGLEQHRETWTFRN